MAAKPWRSVAQHVERRPRRAALPRDSCLRGPSPRDPFRDWHLAVGEVRQGTLRVSHTLLQRPVCLPNQFGRAIAAGVPSCRPSLPPTWRGRNRHPVHALLLVIPRPVQRACTGIAADAVISVKKAAADAREPISTEEIAGHAPPLRVHAHRRPTARSQLHPRRVSGGTSARRGLVDRVEAFERTARKGRITSRTKPGARSVRLCR